MSDEEQAHSQRSMDELVEEMYASLHQLAERALGQGRAHTCDATDIVHECYIKLSRAKHYGGLPRVEFVALAATVIRNELVDRARRRGAKKRGGGMARVTLQDEVVGGNDAPLDLLDLEEALLRLQALDAQQARIVELRFFGGLTNDETAEVLDLKPRAVADEWTMARAWLRRELSR
jgi:RNA polymerase sigma-70 factor (ECF subfamily)